MVHVVKYFVPKGMTGTKNKVKYRRVLVRAWAAGVRQAAHITKTVASRAALRRNPNKMIIVVPFTVSCPTAIPPGWVRKATGRTTESQRSPNSNGGPGPNRAVGAASVDDGLAEPLKRLNGVIDRVTGYADAGPCHAELGQFRH
jgi:hypothetical protein